MFRLFALALFTATLFTAPAVAQSEVGFEKLSIPDGVGAPIEVGVWYPKDTAPGVALPLIVMSHGAGGSYSGAADTAEALARAGFVAAALTHTGDNYREMSRAADVAERPRQLHVLIDYMVKDWTGHGAVDAGRVGAFGFSSGGFTVLAAAGGEPDLTRVIEHCRLHPQFYDCQMIARHPPSANAIPAAWTHDPRIRAVVAAAPALGYTFTREGLSAVTQPVQLWRAANDHVLPHPFYAQVVHDNLPTQPEYHVVPTADHFDFLPPCSPELQAAAPVICQVTPGLDRATFHEAFNGEVVAFFRRMLPP